MSTFNIMDATLQFIENEKTIEYPFINDYMQIETNEHITDFIEDPQWNENVWNADEGRSWNETWADMCVEDDDESL